MNVQTINQKLQSALAAAPTPTQVKSYQQYAKLNQVPELAARAACAVGRLNLLERYDWQNSSSRHQSAVIDKDGQVLALLRYKVHPRKVMGQFYVEDTVPGFADTVGYHQDFLWGALSRAGIKAFRHSN
jgi:hypothetical protein